MKNIFLHIISLPLLTAGLTPDWLQPVLRRGRRREPADVEARPLGLRALEQGYRLLPRIQHVGCHHSGGHGEVRDRRTQGTYR